MSLFVVRGCLGIWNGLVQRYVPTATVQCLDAQSVSVTASTELPRPPSTNHTIQINQQLDATISQVYYLTFMYSSTCFGRPHAHHQELNCSSGLWFYRWSVVVKVLLVVNWPKHDRQHCYHHAPMVKPEAATAVVAPDDGREDARNMLSCT